MIRTSGLGHSKVGSLRPPTQAQCSSSRQAEKHEVLAGVPFYAVIVPKSPQTIAQSSDGIKYRWLMIVFICAAGVCVGGARVCMRASGSSGPPSARPHAAPTHVAGAPGPRPAPSSSTAYSPSRPTCYRSRLATDTPTWLTSDNHLCDRLWLPVKGTWQYQSKHIK